MPSTSTDRIDGLTTSVAVKAPCRVATTANITLSGIQTIAGVLLADSDRVLVKDQTSSVNNGIYVVRSTAWERARDWDGARDGVPGSIVIVRGTGSDVIYKAVCNDNPIVIGTSTVTFTLAAFGDSTSVSFLQAGTGAVARSVQSRLRDTIYATDFGVTGDGSTDDTNTLQAALTAAAGKVLLIPPNLTFLISGVNVSANTTIQMTGATIKQKVLGNNIATAMFTIQGDNVQITGGKFNGQAASQPANGFSDSFNSGANSTGRSFRAAIMADQTAFSSIASLTVDGVEFTGVYGACVACRDVSNVTVRNCYAHSTYFELAWCGRSAATLTDVIYQNNRMKNIGSGSASVNADCLYAARYQRAVVAGNEAATFERCMMKVESCTVCSIVGNVADTNSISNLAALQVDGLNTASYVTITGNTFYNCQAGISLSSGTYNSILIADNNVYTTTGPSTGDGINVSGSGSSTGLVIANNLMWNIKRHGLSLGGQWAGMTITANQLSGQATAGSYGIQMNASVGSWTDIIVANNVLRNFEASTSGAGVFNFSRSSTFVFTNIAIRGNTILSGASANRALRSPGVDLLSVGIISDNYIDGQLELYSASIDHRNNKVTGTITVPAGSANDSAIGATQTTIGANGAASALTANPLGYTKRKVNGTTVIVPYYNP